MSSATVPKISVIIRKAYGAGLYTMCGPAFESDALPMAQIAVMGPEAAVNAVYSNKIEDLSIQKRDWNLSKKKLTSTNKKSIYITRFRNGRR